MRVGFFSNLMSLLFISLSIGLMVASYFVKDAVLVLSFTIVSLISLVLYFHYLNAAEIDYLKARVKVLEKIYD